MVFLIRIELRCTVNHTSDSLSHVLKGYNILSSAVYIGLRRILLMPLQLQTRYPVTQRYIPEEQSHQVECSEKPPEVERQDNAVSVMTGLWVRHYRF